MSALGVGGALGNESVVEPVASSSALSIPSAELPRVQLNEDGLITPNGRTQMAVTYEPVGVSYSTDDTQTPLPALSLIKLYIGQYVIEHGTAAEASAVERMISRSDDALAAKFYKLYPESVDSVAAKYRLYNTAGGEEWGVSRTTAEDVVSFITQLLERDPNSPVLSAMRKWSPVAADGYRQDFGLAGLPGVEGAKMGWSNERAWHSSVVFGPGYVMAAITQGNKRAHTQDVADALVGIEYQDLVRPTPESTRKPARKTSTSSATKR